MTRAVALVPGDSSVQRWGGLAAVFGSLLFLVVFAIVIVFVGADPADAEDLVRRFPGIRAARTAENGLYLLVLIAWVISFVALYRTLRRANLAGALSRRGAATSA